MRHDDAIIRIRPLGGVWEQIGTGAWQGYWPEAIQASSNLKGFDAMSFTLRRDPGSGGAADLKAFTPIELEVASVIVWEGYIWETPTQDSPADISINVNCRGWQYSLDDEQYKELYVATGLAQWRDNRTFAARDVGRHSQNLTVTSDDYGSMVIGAASGTAWGLDRWVGVGTDFGPDPSMWPKRISVEVQRGPGAPTGAILFIRSADDPVTWTGAATDAIAGQRFNTISTSWTTFTGTFSTPHRYVTVIAQCDAAYTAGADDTVLIRAIRCYGETAYESGNQSVLTADTIIKDVVTNAAPQLNPSTARVTATTFAIPDFNIPEVKTSREILDAANAFHNYKLKIGRDKQLIFEPQPTNAVLETQDRPGSEFNDTSANVAEELFNRVIVTGTGPDGAHLSVLRTAAQSALATRLIAPSSPSVANPSFMTTLTGWTTAVNAGTGTIAWDSANAWSGVAGSGSMMFTGTTAGGGAYTTMTGTFKKGQTYIFRFSMIGAPSVASVNPINIQIFDQYPSPNYSYYATKGSWQYYSLTWNQYTSNLHTNSVWEPFEFRWVPDRDLTNPVFFIDAYVSTAGHSKRFDELAIYTSQQTLLDRWGRNRTATLAIDSPITQAAAEQLGDVFLALRSRTPFKGQWTLQGEAGAWGASDGRPVHPSEALLNTAELVRFGHLIDPDTGAVGREGIMATATYTHDDRRALVDVDNTRTDFEALLARLATVTQQRVRY
jgi:hypothetical protein